MKEMTKYYDTPEFRAAQSARMKEMWRKKHAKEAKLSKKIQSGLKAQQQGHNVWIYVHDDEITAKAEILRKLMDKEELVKFLSAKAHSIISESNGYTT